MDHNDSLGLALFTDSVVAPEALRCPLVQDFVSAGADAATSCGAMYIMISPTLRHHAAQCIDDIADAADIMDYNIMPYTVAVQFVRGCAVS